MDQKIRDAARDLVVHIFVGTLLFAVIFTPAVGLDLLLQWGLKDLPVSPYLLFLLHGTKYIIATLDVFLYLIFMYRMARRFLDEIK